MSNLDKRSLRFAPAVNGGLHIGHLWTYYVNKKLSENLNANFILRIDDTASPVSNEWLQKLYLIFKYFRIDFKFKIHQSDRNNLYLSHARKLLRINPHKYQFDENGALCAILPSNISVYDQSRNKFYSKKFSDQRLSCLIRSDGKATYTLASIVDDIELNITDVVRANDHLDNTALQCAVYEGYEKDRKFYHLPLLYTHTGEKISKSNPNHKFYQLDNLINTGYLPESFWYYFDEHYSVLSRKEVRPFKFDIVKLDNINFKIIKNLSFNDLEQSAKKWFSLHSRSLDWSIFSLYLKVIQNTRLKVFNELFNECLNLYNHLIELNLNKCNEMNKMIDIVRNLEPNTMKIFLEEMSSEQKNWLRVYFFKMEVMPDLYSSLLLMKFLNI